jgi:2-hydroxychromene-2-carboxylate isomerase
MNGDSARATFYFDLGSPFAYLAAERLPPLIPEALEWQPVLLGGLFKLTGRSSWALGDDERRQAGIADIERRVVRYSLPPIRWPHPWPGNYLTAMRAATFAFASGRGVEFAMRAFRDAFVRGHDLALARNVLESAEQVGLGRAAVEAALGDPVVKQSLRDATETAHVRGVFGVPTLAIGDQLFWGDDRLEDAAAHLRRATAT